MSTEKIESLKLIGKGIKEARKAAKLTLKKLAPRVGCTPGNLSSIERGGWGPSGPLVVNLARELNLSEKFLTTAEGPLYKEGGHDPGGQVVEATPETLMEKRRRFLRVAKEFAPVADDGMLDALLKNIEQFRRIKKDG